MNDADARKSAPIASTSLSVQKEMGRGSTDSTTEAATPARSGVDRYHLNRSRLRYQGGELLFQRLGHLNAVRQDLGWSVERAPARRGIWAFPFPYFDAFYAYHKFDEVLPKKLRRAALQELNEQRDQVAVPRSELRSALEKLSPWSLKRPLTAEDREQRAKIELQLKELEAKLERIDAVSMERNDARDAWIAQHGRKQLPLRQFSYSGQLYAHLNRRGDVTGYSDWQLLTVAEFVKALRPHEKASGRYCLDWVGEVFIPAAAGRIR